MKSPLAWVPIASGILVLVLSLGLAFATVSSRKNGAEQVTSDQKLQTNASVSSPTLSLSPAGGTFEFNSAQSYPVGIVVDSAGKRVDGIDVIISYDPTRAQIVGRKVNESSLFQETALNTVEAAKGKIKFSALTFDPKSTTGIVGTFSFKPLSKGEVNFSIDFSPGATTDSNIAEHGSAVDVLSGVQNATYLFN